MVQKFFGAVVLIALVITTNTFAQQEKVVAKYADKKITLSEFEKAYAKNAGGLEKAKKDSIAAYEKFLDLYSVFKLKLEDAKKRGYDTLAALNNELTDYKMRVGNTYLLEKEIVEPAIKALYDRRLSEIRASHILIRFDSVATLTKNKDLADSIMKAINSGANYEALCAKYSMDPYTKDKGGDIYYLTAGMVIPEFEEAIYKTKPGTVFPSVVTTRFGYHIIKVTEKKDRIAAVRASHILVDFMNDKGETDTAFAMARIDTVKRLLDNGADFATIAKKYTKDFGTKEAGGDLNFFERRQMVQEFDEAAFNLKIGQISNIVKTNYGFHIIKVTDIKRIPSFEEDKEGLKKLYKRGLYDRDLKTYTAKARTEVGVKVDEANLKVLLSTTDTLTTATYFKLPVHQVIGSKAAFTVGNSVITVDSLVTAMGQGYEFMNKPFNRVLVDQGIEKMVNEAVINEKAMNLDKTNAEFADLMADYKNGIHIFRLQDDVVWSAIKLDSVKLVSFYNANKSNYQWKDRVEFSEIYVKTDSAAKAIIAKLQAGENYDTLASKYTERPGYKEKCGKYNVVDVSSTQLAQEANNINSAAKYSGIIANSNGFSVLKLIKKYPAGTKTFEEAKAEVTGQYQEVESKRLEDEYVIKLKKLNNLVLNKEILKLAFKEVK